MRKKFFLIKISFFIRIKTSKHNLIMIELINIKSLQHFVQLNIFQIEYQAFLQYSNEKLIDIILFSVCLRFNI